MNKLTGVYIDIERMKLKQVELQKNHVQKNPKDEAPKIKLRRTQAKIKALQRYAARMEAKVPNVKTK
jgi:ribosomal protein S15P/S13E